ncbi:hypothetical protein OYE22_25550 [Streptomyces sp. 71268]|uniref:hypothetical protein n=1 Tax=Streptomyces sp. 71268 TaxID=3002640 RepID=UPI0023F6F731|nr:hypothetical protein [Streptomyces sp. 71268]WEV28163.1 hypothetical protein OYE22_25550 [Streptomyces sp. 71268]
MTRQTWVTLLVWQPADPLNPLDVSRAWPRVLQVVRDGEAGPPGVILRPDEPLRQAAARVTAALGLRAPAQPPPLLAVDQRPSGREGGVEQMVLVLDGGTLSTETLPPCGGCGRSHLVWTPLEEAEQPALVHALRARVRGGQPPTLWCGEPVAGG